MPDRLPSLILLVGCWVPAALAGRAAAEFVHRGTARTRPAVVYAGLTTVVLAFTCVWFLINLAAMPPYIPGATQDPTYAAPEAVVGLSVVASALVFPVSLIACLAAFRIRARTLMRAPRGGVHG